MAVIKHIDIARMLGLTQSTVSRALDPNRSHLISQDTKLRVLAKAAELGYQPNIHARRVRMLTSEAITCVIDNMSMPNTGGSYFCEFNQAAHRPIFDMINGLVDGATESGFEVKFMPLHSRQELNKEYILSHLQFPYSDGVIFLGFHSLRHLFDVLKQSQTPKVIVSGFDIPDAPLPTIVPDPMAGIRLGVKALLAKNYRRFLYHTFDFKQLPVYQKERFQAWKQAFEESGVKVRLDTVELPSYAALRKYVPTLIKERAYDAVLAVNDGAAQFWRQELEFCGQKVPGDFAVVGFDGNESFADLGSVVIPYYDIGKAASQTIVAATQNHQPIQSSRTATGFRTGKTI